MTIYTIPGDFATIQAALAAVTSLDIINASGTTQSENVTYAASIGGTVTILFGTGKDDTLVIDWTDATTDISGSLTSQFLTDGSRKVNFSGVEYVAIEMGSGNDTVSGSSGYFEVFGYGGDDTFDAKTGTFRFGGGTGIDHLLADMSGVSGNVSVNLMFSDNLIGIGGDSYISGVERLTLTTGVGNDEIITHDGDHDDTINTGDGDDNVAVINGEDSVVFGGNGFFGDALTINWSNITDGITSFAGGFVAGNRKVTYSGAEYVYFNAGKGDDTISVTGTAIESIYASTGSETISTFGGNDTVILAGDGNDHVDGGDGIDLLSVDFSDATENITGSGKSGSGMFTAGTYGSVEFVDVEIFDLTLGSGDDEVEGGSGDDQIKGKNGNDVLYGLGGSDNLQGGAGNDTLDGGDSLDIMIGGDGDDTYVVDSVLDAVLEDNNDTKAGGIDTVKATLDSVEYLLGANVENLILLGTADVDGTGNSGINSITGNSGKNVLYGGDDAEIDTLTGGDGDDTYELDDNIGDIIVELEDGGTDTVRTRISRTLTDNIENLVLTSTVSINGTGNALANTITGNLGKNTLSGGVDNEIDTLVGGDGDDTYVLGTSTNDIVVEVDGEGSDTITSSISRTLSDFIENLTLTGKGNINGTGNALDNVITGNAGDNELDGGDGEDRLDGKGGDDTYVLGLSKVDTIVEGKGAGTDTVEVGVTFALAANFENLALTGKGSINGTGNSAANTIIGNSGANTIAGLDGKDTLTGGGGADRFEFNDASEGGDTITDFSAADVIRLDGSAFGGLTKANLAGSFITRASDTKAQDAGDRLIYRADTDQLWFDSNGSKAGGLSLIADLDDNFALKASDIQLF